MGVGMDPMLMAALAGGGDPTAAGPAAPLAGLAPGAPAPGMAPPGMAPPGMAPPGMGMPQPMPFESVSPEAMMMQAMQAQQQFAMQQAMAHQVVAEQLGLAANGATQGFMESPAVMPVEPGMQQDPFGGY